MPDMVNVSGVKACAGMNPRALGAIRKRAIHPSPPWPMANGPLFAVSAPLARLVGRDPLPTAWLAGIQSSDVAQTMRRRQSKGQSAIPPALAGFSCFPMGDSVFGFWLSAISRERGVNLTLVNSPLGIQHFAWGSWQFSNRSIVLHGLKGANNPFWDFAMKKGSGAFVPYPRVCDTCKRMGWSSWSGSVVNGWRCCGKAEGPFARQIEHAAAPTGKADAEGGSARDRASTSSRTRRGGGKGVRVVQQGQKGAKSARPKVGGSVAQAWAPSMRTKRAMVASGIAGGRATRAVPPTREIAGIEALVD